MKFIGYFLLIAVLLSSYQARADFQSGLEAIARRDFESALKIFKPLAEKGNAAAQINLGNLYMKGLGTQQSYSIAMRWYRSAAEQGERMAQTKMGILYYHGLGTEKDPVEAARWFQMAAERGEISAQSILGSLYAEGDGVPRDLAQAYYWYTVAEEQGSEEGGKGRKSLEEEMTPGQKDEALRLMSETRKLRIEQEEKSFEAATAGLGKPPEPQAAEESTAKPSSHGNKSAEKKGKPKGQSSATVKPAKRTSPP